MYLSLTKTKFQKRGGWDMKKSWLLGVLMLLAVLPVGAQQVMYSNLKELVENRGDTVTTLKIEKRTKNQIYLMGGADYRITVDDNPGLCRYLKSRCYAVHRSKPCRRATWQVHTTARSDNAYSASYGN